jgi:hypothetical protein
MNQVHHLTIEADDGADVLLACSVESCGRRVVVRRSGGLVVLQQGDFFAFHRSGSDGIEIAADITG